MISKEITFIHQCNKVSKQPSKPASPGSRPKLRPHPNKYESMKVRKVLVTDPANQKFFQAIQRPTGVLSIVCPSPDDGPGGVTARMGVSRETFSGVWRRDAREELGADVSLDTTSSASSSTFCPPSRHEGPSSSSTSNLEKSKFGKAAAA
jgi:hypothetical protein